MTTKQLIAFGSSLLIILILVLCIAFRKPDQTADTSKLDVYKDSLKMYIIKNIEKDSLIKQRDRKLDSLNSIEKKNNYYYHETIHYIYNPNTPIRSLDSIVRAIAINHK